MAVKHTKLLLSRLVQWGVLLLMCAISLLVVGAMRDPAQSAHAMVSSAIWTTFGPHFVLMATVGLLLGVFGIWRLTGWLPRLVSALALLALAGSGYITTSILSAAHQAGGQVSFWTGLALRSMQGDGPDDWVERITFDGERTAMAIYRPEDNKDAPVLLYIHGGGFKTGTSTETDRDLRWFADQGWLVISPDYRLWTEQQASWQLASIDVHCAAVWLQQHAADFGGDSSRLVVMGDSAGGNLALNLTNQWAEGMQLAACEGTPPQAAAVVVQYPAVDPLAIYEHGYPVPGFEPKMLLRGYLGGNPYHYPERVAAINSYSFLTARAAPTLILAPEKDALVPPWSVYRYADYARLAGVELELVRIPFASHVYNQLAANSIGNQARLSITKRFLQQHQLWPAQPAPSRD
ncbi:alpha/beta hydrolase [Alkalimonas delamerensis]|uniref:Alpha/beta hydrolase n=1 Tax=Alkalimonas delamerensis TaxID=265981 RepID=A0ABT9GNT2_9GAMM|nr:alpha/beta hydrolase [Alkalimonas delamerensis]MDP4528445.1 alpha/beta hydrolase [Alkalimonas delamerensis]